MSSRLVKAHLYRNTANIFNARDPETRRFHIDNTMRHNYNSLKAKVVETFQGLDEETLKLYWKDAGNASRGGGEGADELCTEFRSATIPGIRFPNDRFADDVTHGVGRSQNPNLPRRGAFVTVPRAYDEGIRPGLFDWRRGINNSNVLHHGIACNTCGMSPIRGTRYHCKDCPDFDLCVPCQEAAKHPGCVLIQIDVPLTPAQNTRLAASRGNSLELPMMVAALGLRILSEAFEQRNSNSDSDSDEENQPRDCNQQ